jgi:DNA-binding CsgD family transcriptional regulator
MAAGIVGRETELDAVERFLDTLTAGPAGLVIDGEAGIGKSTVWLEGVRSAESRFYRVLQARPAESEAKLSYAALTDLIGEAFDEVHTALPAPQERALATALLRTELGEPADARTTATGLVGVLTVLAADTPLLVAVDDVQWLDPASVQALAFAVRRLPPRLGLLLTRRTEIRGEAPLGLGQVLPDDRLQRCVCGPLSFAALHALITTRLGTSPARPTLVRITEACGGNPFFALEIARALARDGRQRSLGDPLPVPPSLQELMARRVGALPALAGEAVLVAASLSRPTLALISEALAPKRDALPALIAAEEAGILASEGERVRFTHPLLASAVYATASPSRRRQLHGRLAEVVADPEERGRHLAFSVTEADEATAARIEEAARRSAVRGAQAAAAELFEQARRLTPADHREAVVRRMLGQAVALHATGEVDGARSLGQQAVDDSPTPSLRARGLLLLADVEWDAGAVEAVIQRLEEALAAATDDRELHARISMLLVQATVLVDPKRALEHAKAAQRLLDEERAPGLLAWVLIDRFLAEALLGRGPSRALLERGLELEARAGPAVQKHPVPVIWFDCTDEFDAARARHALEDAWYRDRGDERTRAERLGYLVLAELRAGRWDLAEQYANQSCGAIEQLDASGPHALAYGWRSLVDAHRGRIQRARSTLQPLIQAAEQTRAAWWVAHLLSALGFVEFAAGDHQASDRALQRMREHFDSIGVVDGLLDRSEPFHVESLLALGQLDRAREALWRLQERGRTLPRRWITVTLPRARALLLTAGGDPQAALAAVDELDRAAAAELPFELGWALLVRGRLLRRLKRRRSAAETLKEALAIFDRLGAPAWAQQARSELARVGPRRRSPEDLTATELRVAELTAAGLTNREVAEAAFMSPKTVEAHLARVYRKLGIRSRAELGARMHDPAGRTQPRT